jgi:biopolymer transport protein ExbD
MRRRHSLRRPEHAFEGINATPLIDVVMCLIVFFLIVGKLSADRSQQVRLPETRHGASAKAQDPMVLDIVRAEAGSAGAAWLGGAGRLLVAGKEVADGAALESLVRGRLLDRPATSVEIRADRDLPYGAVEPVLRACGKAGARSVRLAAEKRS